MQDPNDASSSDDDEEEWLPQRMQLVEWYEDDSANDYSDDEHDHANNSEAHRLHGYYDSDDDSDDDENQEQDATSPVPMTRAVAATSRQALALLPPELRASIERTFVGQPLAAMRFVPTEQEKQQRIALLDERIAHELRNWTVGPMWGRHMATKTERKAMLSGNASPETTTTTRTSPFFYALRQREQCGRTSKAEFIQLHETFMPFQQHKHCSIVDQLHERLYCGGFDSTGRRFLVAGQFEHIIVYDTMDWTRQAILPARDVQWTVTDAKFTPDDQSILYASIFNHVRMVDTNYDETSRESVFHLTMPRSGHEREPQFFFRRGFAVWSLDVNGAGTQFIAGTSNNSVVLVDMATERTLSHVVGHSDDVNSVAFVDGQVQANVFVSGSDDTLIKLWDRRVLSESNPRPQGVFPGHIDGLTYVSSRGDGYYFLSNAKDQTCKLWDIRKCVSAADHARQPHFHKPYRWDYRYHQYPGLRKLPIAHPHDASVMTYRGHQVAETLIRCHFSPLHTTAQKYVFTGSADGRVYVFDTVSGALVEIFSMRRDGVTRDVRWHPYEPTIVSPDFYGKLCVWERHDASHDDDEDEHDHQA